MHSFLARLNNLFAFMSSVLSAVTFLVFLQTLFVNYTVPVDIEITNVKLKPVNDYASSTGRSDMASQSFSLSADLAPVFNWNVKQLYVWLQADYSTEARERNSLILWDRYYHRFENSVVNIKSGRPAYYFMDDGTSLRGRDVNYTLHWTVVPNAGWMRNIVGSGSKVVNFPKEYSSNR